MGNDVDLYKIEVENRPESGIKSSTLEKNVVNICARVDNIELQLQNVAFEFDKMSKKVDEILWRTK